MKHRQIVFAGCEDRRGRRVHDVGLLPAQDLEGKGPADSPGEVIHGCFWIFSVSSVKTWNRRNFEYVAFPLVRPPR